MLKLTLTPKWLQDTQFCRLQDNFCLFPLQHSYINKLQDKSSVLPYNKYYQQTNSIRKSNSEKSGVSKI